MMLHHPFLKTMVALAEDGPAWQAVGAGYLVLRVFDDWLRIGPQRMAADLALSNTYGAIAALPEDYRVERRVLEGALQGLSRASGPEPSPVIGPLMAYGTMLEHRGLWESAADVYQTIAQGVTEFGVPPDLLSVAIARLREGACWRQAHDYGQSVTAYKVVARLARRAKNDALRLQARLGLAHVTRARGDLPGAEAALDDLLVDTERYPPPAALLRPAILHSRGSVRQARGRHTEAIVDLYEAYQTTPDAVEQELILGDLGVCAADAGYRDAARNALEVIALTGRNPLARQTAVVNLIEIAVLSGDQLAFEQWRGAWSPGQCNALANAYAKLYVARGVERFQGREWALPAFLEAADYADHVGIHQAQFEALHDLERLQEAVMAPTRAARPVPPSLNYIAEALADLRDVVELTV